MPDSFGSTQEGLTTILNSTKSATLSGSTFGQRREDIFKRLQQSVEQCKLNYSGRTELASEQDDIVLELCEALEDTFSYGLRLRQQQATIAVTAATIFQNMQEIVTGNIGFSNSTGNSSNDVTFWDFCQVHLTSHEKARYENLKNIWTKCGRGRAFIRAALNENSLHRYILIWLNDKEQLSNFYTQWSFLLNAEVAPQLPEIIASLDKVLFALTFDSVDLNVSVSRAGSALPKKEEPIIYAPPPAASASTKTKRKITAVERPIAGACTSKEDLAKSLNESIFNTSQSLETIDAEEELAAPMTSLYLIPPDPIEPELEFLKQPLPDVYPENQTVLHISNGTENKNSASGEQDEDGDDDKSDSSSQYSKSSSANCCANHPALEERMREMTERCLLLETRVRELELHNRVLTRRLTQYFNESGIDPTSSLATNFLITIPVVKLHKSKPGSSYYTYEVHITMRQRLEHWSVLRRYSEFYKLHKSLLRSHPTVASVEFPPKKHFGNRNPVFVDERRQQLQIYLLNLVETLPQVEACKTKAELQKVFPFLRENGTRTL